MTIEQPDIIDFISIPKDSSCFSLVISDHLEWDLEKQHLLKLQIKINTYLRFIESGEIYDKFPDAKGKKLIIVVTFKNEPTELARQFLARARQQIEAACIGFQHETLPITKKS